MSRLGLLAHRGSSLSHGSNGSSDSDALSEKLMPIGTWAANVSQSVKTSPDQTQAP